MFRSFICLDSSRLKEYMKVLGRRLGKDPSKWSVEVKAEAGIASIAKVGADIKRPAPTEQRDSFESLYDLFEGK